MKQQIEARIKELEAAINQSVANHNALIGQLNEAKYILEMQDKLESVSDEHHDSSIA